MGETGKVDCRWACNQQQNRKQKTTFARVAGTEEINRTKEEEDGGMSEEMLRGREKSRRDRPSIEVENERFRFKRQLQLMT